MSEATTVDTTRDLAGNDVSTDVRVGKEGIKTKPRPKPGTKKPAAATAKASKSNPKAPAKNKTVKKAVKDTSKYAPKSKPMPNGQSVHADEDKREPNWNSRRIAIVKAMRTLRATDSMSARTAEEIAKKAGTVDGVNLTERVDLVKIVLDVYRTSELLHNGFAKSVKHEGERGLRYYLTKKGQTTEFPQK